jgi:hypothetical protein
MPEAVQQMRTAIHDAAAECDLEALGELASDDGFTYSFGDGDDLVGVLERPFAEREVQGTPQYE